MKAVQRMFYGTAAGMLQPPVLFGAVGVCATLRTTDWMCRDPNRAQEEWFGNANSLQEKTGLFEHQPPLTNHEVSCPMLT
jgi:hypothetical protein